MLPKFELAMRGVGPKDPGAANGLSVFIPSVLSPDCCAFAIGVFSAWPEWFWRVLIKFAISAGLQPDLDYFSDVWFWISHNLT
jgi:hypothetical protein